MKKIMFIDSYFDSVYGAQKSMCTLSDLLDDDGYDVTIGSFEHGKLSSYVESRGANFEKLVIEPSLLLSITKVNSFLKLIGYVITLLRFWFSSFLTNKRKLDDFDIICFNDIRCFIYLLPVVFLIRKQLVWYVRIREENKFLCDFFAFFCSRVIFVSNDLSSVFSKSSSDTKKFVVVNTGFPYVAYEKRGDERIEALRFVNVGSISKRKNQLQTLRIFEEIIKVMDCEVTLDFIGTPEDGSEGYYQSLLDEVELNTILKERVNFLGYQKDVLGILPNYDVFLFNSKREGLPRCVIESLQCGLFVVSTEVEGISDILFDESLGIIYDDNCLNDVSDMILKLMNPHLFECGKRESRSTLISESFSMSKFLSEFKKKVLE